jgi:thiol-disulfide isomerase/thioredoxin
MRIADLRDKVVLIDVWTFDCWNCYRSFPWLKSVEDRYGPKGLNVIGVHSPEFERERDREAVAAKVREFGLDHPVMIDNDFTYWDALGNRFWPAFYLVDKQGRIRHRFFGETHEGDPRAGQIESAIEKLLSEGS